MRNLSFVEALNQALKEEMRRDPLVFVLGEDIGKMGGLFGVTAGLSDEFGPSGDRYADFGGRNCRRRIGAALVGTRPVIEFQFSTSS